MNIHPMFVHFPVALFLTYSLLEVLRAHPKIKNLPYWFYTKAIIVVLGALAALITIITGVMAKSLHAGDSLIPIINIHETFAITTTIVYCAIAFFHIIGWIKRSSPEASSRIPIALLKVEWTITEGKFGIFLAVFGAILISCTAALGGLLAYGPDNDPVSHFIYYSILFRQ
jgi:uncharacterized membrane protein